MPRSWLYGLPALISGSGHDSASATSDQVQVYAAMLLSETREEIDRADDKASILLAASGVAGGALLAGLLGGSWSPAMLHGVALWLFWSGVAAASGGISCLACAVYPRTRRRGASPPAQVGYFGDVLAFADSEDLLEALEGSAELRIGQIADQLRQVSLIVDRKYRLVRRGMWLLLAALLSCGAAAAIEFAR